MLSNLDIIENIALIREVHEGLERNEAQAAAMEALARLGAGHIAHRRSAACSLKELFIAQVVRASMLHYAKIIIIRPFFMLKDTEDIHMVLSCLRSLKHGCDCVILDMKANRAKYEAGGEACTIIE